MMPNLCPWVPQLFQNRKLKIMIMMMIMIIRVPFTRWVYILGGSAIALPPISFCRLQFRVLANHGSVLDNKTAPKTATNAEIFANVYVDAPAG